MKRRITRYECVALIKTPLFTAALSLLLPFNGASGMLCNAKVPWRQK